MDTENNERNTVEASANETRNTEYAENISPNFTRSAGGSYASSNVGVNRFNGNEDEARTTDSGNGGMFFIDPEYYARRKAMLRLGNAVGFPLFMFFAGSILLQYVIVFVLALTSGTEAAYKLLSDPNVQLLENAFISLAVLTVPYLYTSRATGIGIKQLIVFDKVPLSKGAPLVMLGLGSTVLCNYITNVIASFSQNTFGIEFRSSMIDFGTDGWSFAIALLCVGLLPALLEEFAMRGVVLGALRARLGDTASIFVTALLFGLLHGNLVQIPFAFLMGIILGYVTVYSGSVMPAVIIHALNNSISVALEFALRDLSPLMGTVMSLLYYAVALVIGVCGFILLIKNDGDALRLSRRNTEHTAENLKWLCCSPWIIVFVIACIFEVLIVQGVITL